MPYWRDLLTEEEIREVVSYIKKMSPVYEETAPRPLVIPPRVPPDEASIARGKALFTTQVCVVCHGPEARGMISMKDMNGYTVVSRDLTAPWTFRGGSSPEQVWLRITTGLAPSPMPAFETALSPTQRWDLVNYVLSLQRRPPWEPGGKLDGPGQQPDLLRRGEYLTHASMCGICHTEVNRMGIYRGDTHYLAGGQIVKMYPHGNYFTRNLTSDPETGLGKWTEEEVRLALQTGRARGRILNQVDMPWHFLAAYSETDALAMARYLKSQPPVYNRIPDSLRYGVLETVLVKLTMHPPAFRPDSIAFREGTYGEAPGQAPRDLLQSVMVYAQGFVAVVIGVILVLWRPVEQRSTGRRAWMWSGLKLIGGFLIIGIGWLVYELPASVVIPPTKAADVFLNQVYRPDLPQLPNPEQVAMVERGRSLYTVASCAMCHRGNGRGGGKISWRPFGTYWSRNISSDKTAGIGAWSDREIARAIRSGVSRDGGVLVWQGMIWDHASNLDEEDVRSIIAFLRTLPPVERKLPRPTPPGADDCELAVFWLADDILTPGCTGQ